MRWEVDDVKTVAMLLAKTEQGPLTLVCGAGGEEHRAWARTF